jgi:hypothetical protein
VGNHQLVCLLSLAGGIAKANGSYQQLTASGDGGALLASVTMTHVSGRPVSRRSLLLSGGAAVGTAVLVAPAAHAAASTGRAGPGTATIHVASGQTYVVAATTRISAVTIEAGGVLTAPSGHSLTMTVNGVEAGQKLTATSGADTAFVAGSWRGDIVLTVSTAYEVGWQEHTYPFRQAVYAGSAGIVPEYSVLAAAAGAQAGSTSPSGLRIFSTGECFDGVVVEGGRFALRNSAIALDGNGRCDFVGYGAAVLANGTGTSVVLDGVVVDNHGAVRTAAICDNGATLVVKNSRLSVANGTLPPDYLPTVNLDTMEDAPWMLGINGGGNCRATNLLGNNSVAAYVNSSITSESWGVLSTDSGSDCCLVTVNSKVANTGDSGYGTYGDSDRESVASLNASLGLGLTDRELRALTPRSTVVNSRGWGFMWHAASDLTITGGTKVNSRRATFLNKGQAVAVAVDGSKGARFSPGDETIIQVMDNDDPGPVMVDGVLENAGVYAQPTGEPSKDSSFEVTVAHDSDSVFSFTDISLAGHFYNGMRGNLNLVLKFSSSQVAGVITATLAEHHTGTIDSGNWYELGVVSNTPQAAINNGVIVSLTDHSAWTVTGTSYLTALSLDATSVLRAPAGRTLDVRVDGSAVSVEPGATYSGAIVITIG